MYVGGLAESVAGRMGSLAGDAEGFKGCIRNMNVNGRSYDLAGVHNVVHRVGQCFASVETGSYFPGDAYAIYSASFCSLRRVWTELSFTPTTQARTSGWAPRPTSSSSSAPPN